MIFRSILVLIVSSLSVNAENEKWFHLLDENMTHWDIFMGVPHTSVEGLGDHPKEDDTRDGTPIGLNKDPKKVFRMVKENGEDILHITGEIWAGYVTKKAYQNYHFSAEFKWGEKKWEPRLDLKRNSGILYHSVGNFDDFWKVWMTCLEFEVQETDCGDFITLGNVRAKCPNILKGKKFHFSPGAPLTGFAWEDGFQDGRCYKSSDEEKPHGEWNLMELYCFGNTNIHVVNGKVVMVVQDPTVNLGKGWESLQSGKIQLQSESAEIFYKNLKIKNIKEIPQEIRKESGIE